MMVYRDGQCGTEQVLLFRKEIASGIPDSVISKIVENSHTISNPSDVARFSVLSIAQARQVYHIVQSMS